MKTYKTPLAHIILISSKMTMMAGSNTDQLNVYSDKVIDRQEDALSNSFSKNSIWEED